MPQLKLKLSLDKRLTLSQQKRRYKRLVKRYEKQIAYAHRHKAFLKKAFEEASRDLTGVTEQQIIDTVTEIRHERQDLESTSV